MESSEEGDDQGSGWLLVKKKHRSSSKFSVHGWVGGLSVKQNSRNMRSQTSSGIKFGNDNYVGQPSKARGDNAVFDPGPNNEDSNLQAAVIRKHPQGVEDNHSETNNSDVLPKIKWGDLDEGTLLLHQGKTVGAEIKFGRIGSPILVCRKSEDSDGSVPHSSSSGHKENNFVSPTADKDHSLLASHSQLSRKNSLENNSKQVNEVPLEDSKMQIIDDRTVDANCSVSSCYGRLDHKKAHSLDTSSQSELNNLGGTAGMHLTAAVVYEAGCCKVSELPFLDGDSKLVVSSPNSVSRSLKEGGPETTKSHNPSKENVTCAATEEAVMIQAPATVYEKDCSEVSGVPVIDDDAKILLFPQDSESLSPDKTGCEVNAKSTLATSMEDLKSQAGDAVFDDSTKTQIMDHIGANVEESKERFRERLWCFLFENLNRAVDELYLLCELECDLEQLKEAIIVLEEAASDFKDLNSRVEEFDEVKKSSSYMLDGPTLTMKSDHRRPHALSWEVRRMTTSPRRAEILSSSLEAFRKIQQERAIERGCDAEKMGAQCHSGYFRSSETMEKDCRKSEITSNNKGLLLKPMKQQGGLDLSQGNLSREKKNVDSNRFGSIASSLPLKECSATTVSVKNKWDLVGATSETEKQLAKKDKTLTENMTEKNPKSVDPLKRQILCVEREKEKRNGNLWKSMDAWKEKRNWEDILAPPHRVSSRYSHSPGISRKSAERARTLHDKLMSSDKKKKSVLDLKKEAEEKHARAMRIRNELESERVQRLQRTSEKLNRVNEFQAERSMKLREVMYARHQRSESRHEAFLAQVVRRANDESSKVNEVRFITSLNEENKKLILRQKLHDSELRKAEKLQLLKTKQKEDMAREEAVLERKKLLEAEKLQRIAEIQRKKEEAQVRREEERKASSAAREAKAMEQMRRKEVRARAQQEEAELLAQKLAERLSESEQRRKFYLEQIKERASMDFRDQTSPFLRRSVNKEGQGRSTPNSTNEDCQANNTSTIGACAIPTGSMILQHSLKRRIKKIRQKLMALKHEYFDPSVGMEVAGIGYRTTVGTARAKIGRWLQDLQKLRQARKEGATSFGLITAEMSKFLEGKDAELQASRQAGLLDFIASALPASHTTKPEACHVTLCLLRLLRVVLSAPANRSYFLSQNLLPPIIPMLAAALENYIKIAASAIVPGSTRLISSKSSTDNLDSISEILDGFLWTVAMIIGHVSFDERQIQMQHGLLELVIAYQVVHRLRDLFALYDRPHVEGSPFPSSIILSIKLLAVLTSRFRNVSSIDWKSFPSDVTFANGSDDVKVADIVDSKGLPDVPEDRPFDESLTTKGRCELSPNKKNSDEVESIALKTGTADATHESPFRSITKCSVPLKEDEKSNDKVAEQKDEVRLGLKQPVEYLLLAISETGLVCLPSMLTAVLLQANNRLSSEQVSYVLPSNFEEVATGVLRVLNNLALININFMQRMLARPDLKMEFFHLMSFLLSHCTSKWSVATDQIGLLLLESLSLLGYFALFHPENQAVLRWGKSPTILHKVCDLPFIFFSDPELMPILAGTLIAACYGCQQNKSVILQELSMDMLLSLLKACRNSSPAVQSITVLDNPPPDEPGESNQLGPECRKLQLDVPPSQRSHRYNMRNTRIPSQKGAPANNIKSIKMRNQRENKLAKLYEDIGEKYKQNASETSALMLHIKFPESFIDRAEHFFSA